LLRAWIINSTKKIAVSIFVFGATIAHADDMGHTNFNRFLANVNYAPSMDGAYSYGDIGSSVGLLVQSLTPQMNNAWFAENLPRHNQENFYLPSLMLTKGLPYNFNMGISLGHLHDTTVRKVSGFAQWTIFEGFRLPAFAVKGTYSQLSGLTTSTIRSNSLSLNASYSFLNYFTVFASTGIVTHTVETETSDAISIAITSTNDFESHDRFANNFYSLGCKVVVWAPYTSLALESYHANDSRMILGKLTVGM
jgi:hypothetical protein